MRNNVVRHLISNPPRNGGKHANKKRQQKFKIAGQTIKEFKRQNRGKDYE